MLCVQYSIRRNHRYAYNFNYRDSSLFPAGSASISVCISGLGVREAQQRNWTLSWLAHPSTEVRYRCRVTTSMLPITPTVSFPGNHVFSCKHILHSFSAGDRTQGKGSVVLEIPMNEDDPVSVSVPFEFRPLPKPASRFIQEWRLVLWLQQGSVDRSGRHSAGADDCSTIETAHSIFPITFNGEVSWHT